MKNLILVLLFVSSSVLAGDPFFDAEQQNINNRNAQAQAQYDAQVAEQSRQQHAIAQQQAIENKLKQQQIAANAAANKRAAENARVAQANANARAKAAQAAENARLAAIATENAKDKVRAQMFEDNQAQINRERADLETQQLKAQADLETAIAAEKIKRSNELVNAELNRAKTETDVVQSEADATRTLSSGVQTKLAGEGNEGLYKFLFMASTIALVLMFIIIIGVIYFASNKNKKTEGINTPQEKSIKEKP